MPILTPKFWYPKNKGSAQSALSCILWPISALYRIISRVNYARKIIQKADIPVICIGNITAGGSGKTPTCIALVQLIKENTPITSPYFLTRGYGASEQSTRCITGHEPACTIGDEPKILAKHCNTVISANRYDGAQCAMNHGADVIIMDDGFQNPSLHKDISILVVDGKTGFGNQKTIPSGPLRESLKAGISRADACIIIGEDIYGAAPMITAIKPLPIFSASIMAKHCTNKDQKFLAFAGLGHPEKFHDTLLAHSYKVTDFTPYPDHHPYSDKEIEKLIEKAAALNAKLITTEKDFMRIDAKYHEQIEYLPIHLEFNNKEKIIAFLQNTLSSLT